MTKLEWGEGGGEGKNEKREVRLIRQPSQVAGFFAPSHPRVHPRVRSATGSVQGVPRTRTSEVERGKGGGERGGLGEF